MNCASSLLLLWLLPAAALGCNIVLGLGEFESQTATSNDGGAAGSSVAGSGGAGATTAHAGAFTWRS